METGWIKLHRQLLNWEWYTDEKVFRVFLHLLLKANHEKVKWKGYDVEIGQRITSYQHLSDELGLGVQSIRTALNKLKSTGEITVKNNNKHSIITILKYKSFQSTDKLTGEQQATNKQLTTNKNYKNEKNKYTSKEVRKNTEPKSIGRIIGDKYVIPNG